LEFVKNGRLIDGVFMVMLPGTLNIIKMKGNRMKPRTGLILIAIIFIFAGSFDYADELNNQKHTQYVHGE
jgi:hypothetical protein